MQEVNKEYFKNLLEPKIWVSNLHIVPKIIFLLLIILGIILIVLFFQYKDDLEEFSFIPLISGLLDFLLVYIFITKNIGYKIYFTGKDVIVSKFSKEIVKLNLKNISLGYKKKFLYDTLEMYDQKKLVFTIYSYWFKYQDFSNMKNTLFGIKKYLDNIYY